MNKRILLAACAAAATVFTAIPTHAAPVEIVVDDDLAQCPNAEFTSIQAAIDASAPGNRIRVCAGTYREVVTVGKKDLQLVGASDPGVCNRPAAPDPARESVIQAVNASGGAVNLVADGAGLSRFTVQNNSAGPGIATGAAFSGYVLERNVVQNNVSGIRLNILGGTQNEVEKNCVRQNNRPGRASGYGIHTDRGLDFTEITENSFYRNRSAAIVLAGDRPGDVSDVDVELNTSERDGSLLAISNSVDSEVERNVVRGSAGAAVFVGNDNDWLQIQYNTVKGGAGGLRTGTDSGGVPGLGPDRGPSTDVRIVRNRIDGVTAGDGISVSPDSLMDSLISHNLTTDNARSGIRIDAGPGGGNRDNLVAHNRLRGNGEHDCHDRTRGKGTAGTANTWRNSRGGTENRPGLCKR